MCSTSEEYCTKEKILTPSPYQLYNTESDPLLQYQDVQGRRYGIVQRFVIDIG